MAFQAALLDFHGRHVSVYLRPIVLRDARIVRKRWVGIERIEARCFEFVGLVFGIARIEVHEARGVARLDGKQPAYASADDGAMQALIAARAAICGSFELLLVRRHEIPHGSHLLREHQTLFLQFILGLLTLGFCRPHDVYRQGDGEQRHHEHGELCAQFHFSNV